MSRASKRPPGQLAAKAKRSADPSGKKPAKRPTNLTLDPEAVARGERYGQRHQTSLSQLVTSFLYSLPAEDTGDGLPRLTPVVRRLYGVVAGGGTDRDDYRNHLVEKYGGR